jgi:hypothetical protein
MVVASVWVGRSGPLGGAIIGSGYAHAKIFVFRFETAS